MTDASGTGRPAAGKASEARYEFRVFGEDLAAARAALAGLGEMIDTEEREDVYILAPARPDASLKLRGGRLELKLMVDRDGPFERWRPDARVQLPSDGRTLADRFLDPYGLRLDVPAAAPLDAEALLGLAARCRAVATVAVRKRRTRHAIEGGMGEWTALGIAGAPPLQSVAAESPDPSCLRAFVAALGLDATANISYPRKLMQVGVRVAR
jgi:hypothetical protein